MAFSFLSMALLFELKCTTSDPISVVIINPILDDILISANGQGGGGINLLMFDLALFKIPQNEYI